MLRDAGSDNPKLVIPLYADELSINRREVERGGVRVSINTNTREHIVDEPVTNTRVEVKRIPIGRIVEAAPPVRTEGDTIIIPVMEETIVVERRLILKEEIILRRVHTDERHRERVSLREQEAVIERQPAAAASSPSSAEEPIIFRNEGVRPMINETIVAVFDTPAHAAAAVNDLENAGVPSSAISQHAQGGITSGSVTTPAPRREPGFWEKLFGGEPERQHDTAVYNRSLESGATVVTVQTEEHYLSKVMDILERHNPVDIDERGAGYVDIGAVTSADDVTEAATIQSDPAMRSSGASDIPTQRTGRSTDEQTMQLAEEELAVGKRAINRGTTRVRRYVVETPVEEQVNLRRESVSVERRPVTNDRPVTDANFSDKVVEMTETDEEAVVAKTARVKEEVVIHKDTDERIETVRDTVRREEAEVTKDAGTSTTTTASPMSPKKP
jgi:uncharacterized protein (TIGR02271 family)